MPYETAVQTVAQTTVALRRRGPQLTPHEWHDLVSTVPAEERRRIELLRRWQDRQDCAIAWGMLDQLVREWGVRVRRGADGRPYADPPADVSVAHSGGWIAVAVNAERRVGIEIETLRTVTPSLARRCLARTELAWWQAAEPGEARDVRFLQAWTAKEAYLNATRTGLAVDPRVIRIDHTGSEPQLLGLAGSRWQFSCSTPAPGVYVAVCTERSP